MRAFCDEHSAPLVQADFTRSILDRTFCGAKAVIGCMFVLYIRAMDRTQISTLTSGCSPALLLPCWVTLGKSHLLALSQSPYLQNGDYFANLWKNFVVCSGVAIFRNKALL